MDLPPGHELALDSCALLGYFLFCLNDKEDGVVKKLKFIAAPVLILVIAYLLLSSVVGYQPFKYDEAVYLSKARNWMEGTPANEWKSYRPIGSAAVGYLALHFTATELGLRQVGVIAGALTTVGAYLLFAEVFGLLAGLVISSTIMLSPLFLKESTQFLNDIPSSGLIFYALWLIAKFYKNSKHSWLLYLSSLLLGLVFYVRYGAIAIIGIIFLTSGILFFPQFVKHKLKIANIIISGFVFALLLSAHLLQSYRIHGNPLGIILDAGGAASSPAYIGESFVQYWKLSAHNNLAGKIIDYSAPLGLIFTIILLVVRKYAVITWIGSIGLVSLLVIGLSTHAEARYIFLPLVLLSAVGILLPYNLLKNSKYKIFSFFYIFLVLVLSIFTGARSYQQSKKYFEDLQHNRMRHALTDVAHIIKEHSDNSNGCVVWTNTARPEISWYAGCNTTFLSDRETFEKDYLKYYRKDHYAIYFTNSDGLQLSPGSYPELNVRYIKLYQAEDVADDFGDLELYEIKKYKFDSIPRLNEGN